MRAYAALAVFLIHAGGAGFRELGIVGNNIADFGRAGVYVFFVISGFSVASSYEASNGYLDYISKRLWRIAPLYYFWITLSACLAVFYYKDQSVNISAYNLIMHISFLSFLDYRIANSIMSIEWSIPVEIFWYITLPILIKISNSRDRAIALLIVSGLIYALLIKHSSILPVSQADAGRAMHYLPFPYIISYVAGVLAYRARPLVANTGRQGDVMLCAVIMLIFLYLKYPSLVLALFYDELVFVSLITFAMIVFGTSRSVLVRILFDNKIIQFLGLLSYGIYLAHVPVIGYLQSIGVVFFEMPPVRFLIGLSITIPLALVTYILIERPGINFGQQIIARRTSVA